MYVHTKYKTLEVKKRGNVKEEEREREEIMIGPSSLKIEFLCVFCNVSIGTYIFIYNYIYTQKCIYMLGRAHGEAVQYILQNFGRLCCRCRDRGISFLPVMGIVMWILPERGAKNQPTNSNSSFNSLSSRSHSLYLLTDCVCILYI